VNSTAEPGNVKATNPLRTGTYAKTLTFTLSTNNP